MHISLYVFILSLSLPLCLSLSLSLSLYIPQTDLSEGVLAVLVRGLVIATGHRAAKCLRRFVVKTNTKSIFLQKLNAF
jgi:hypothetical protein